MVAPLSYRESGALSGCWQHNSIAILMMIRPADSTTQANTSAKTAWSAVGNLDSVGADADKTAVVARLIEQV